MAALLARLVHMRNTSRVRSCWFKRANQHCQEPAAENDNLCTYHVSGGCSLDENTFYSVRTGQFLSTRTTVPETDDIKGDRLEDVALFGGGTVEEASAETVTPSAETVADSVLTAKRKRTERGQFRKCCRVCWTFRRPKSLYCSKHNKPLGRVDMRRTSESYVACQFFDALAQQTGMDIIHRHVRADGVMVGEELKLKIHKDRKVSVDGYVADQKLVLEFLGDFFHGNPDKYKPWHRNASRKTTFRVLYEETYARHKAIAETGYQVRYIWESDFKRYLKEPNGQKLWDLLRPWNDWAPLPAEPRGEEDLIQISSVEESQVIEDLNEFYAEEEEAK